MSETAIKAMLPYFDGCYANPSSLHTPGQLAKDALARARADIAATLNCKPNEIYFTSGGSESDNQAIISAAAVGERKGKKHIISSAIEHHAVCILWTSSKNAGSRSRFCPFTKTGSCVLRI